MSSEPACHSKEDILKLLTSSKNAIAFWSSSLQLTPNIITSNTEGEETQVKSSEVEDPLEELIKLTKLTHAHITKIGIVFKPPISSNYHNACYKELELTSKTIVYVVSLSNQLIKDSKLYSELFVQQLLKDIKILLSNYCNLTTELKELLNEDNVNPVDEKPSSDPLEGRLISVGKVWESCDKIQKISKLGPSGLIKLKLKESNKLIVDAFEELEEWNENPLSSNDDDDPFGLGEDNDDFTDDESASESKVKEPSLEPDDDEDDKVNDELIQFSKKSAQKINLVKLLVLSLDKSIPQSKYTVKFANGIDLLEIKRKKLGELVDDVVAAIIYDLDIDEAKDNLEQLKKEATKVVDIVKGLNSGDEKKTKWLDTWEIKFNE